MDENHLTLNEAINQDKNDMKAALKAKWNEVKNMGS